MWWFPKKKLRRSMHSVHKLIHSSAAQSSDEKEKRPAQSLFFPNRHKNLSPFLTGYAQSVDNFCVDDLLLRTTKCRKEGGKICPATLPRHKKETVSRASSQKFQKIFPGTARK